MRSVDFPHPLRPNRTVISPAVAHADAALSTTVLPNDLRNESAKKTAFNG